MTKPPRCPSLNRQGIWCTFPEGHDGEHQGIETQYRWSEAYIVREAYRDRVKGLTPPPARIT